MEKLIIMQVSAHIYRASYVVSDDAKTTTVTILNVILNECITLQQLYSEQLKTALPTVNEIKQIIEFCSSCSAGEKGKGNGRKLKHII